MKFTLTLLAIIRQCSLAICLLIAAINMAHAYTGWCSPDTGSAYQYHYTFGNITVLDVNKNVAGFLFPKAYQWNLGGAYAASCDCDPVEEMANHYADSYFSSQTQLPLGHTDGSYQFYKINDYLEVAADVWVEGYRTEYVPLPWNNISNYLSQNHTFPIASGSCKGSTLPVMTWQTGNKGRMKIYISKPFVGSTFVDNVKIVDIYGSTVSGSYGGIPLSSVYINGTITAPQNCEINAGQMVTVDFGKIWAGEFTTKGQRPNSTTPKNVSVPIKCNNIAAFANLTLRIESEPSAETPEAIKTNNPDVGVEILDDNGHLLLPNTGLVPFSVDENFEATVTFKAVPVSTTGNTPASGLFQAQAYIRIDFA